MSHPDRVQRRLKFFCSFLFRVGGRAREEEWTLSWNESRGLLSCKTRGGPFTAQERLDSPHRPTYSTHDATAWLAFASFWLARCCCCCCLLLRGSTPTCSQAFLPRRAHLPEFFSSARSSHRLLVRDHGKVNFTSRQRYHESYEDERVHGEEHWRNVGATFEKPTLPHLGVRLSARSLNAAAYFYSETFMTTMCYTHRFYGYTNSWCCAMLRRFLQHRATDLKRSYCVS